MPPRVGLPLAGSWQQETAEGPARVLEVRRPDRRPDGRQEGRPDGKGVRGTLVLGHGAGGGFGGPDIAAAATAATVAGWRVLLVEQPWLVAGRRAAAPPPRLDVAWLAVLAALTAAPGGLAGPLVLGGRSAGARVACRTATELGADGVLCLAFPLHPPGRPERSRAEELLRPRCPVLVVQGESDPFGGPAEVAAAARRRRIRVAGVRGNHDLSAEPQVIARTVGGWLARRPRPASPDRAGPVPE